jgi:glycosyltransferase involved in cell wall biosynthesis
MKKKQILSPMTKGNGAYIAHRLLEAQIKGYRVVAVDPKWTFLPFMLPIVASMKGADLIHTTPDHAVFFHRKSIPLVSTFQNYVLDRKMRPYSAWYQIIHYATDLKALTRLALKKSQAITAVSQSTAELVKQDLDLDRSCPIRVIYNGVNTNHFIPDSHKKPKQSSVRVLFSGNLTIRKGANLLPRIAKYLNTNITLFYTQGLRSNRMLTDLPNLQSVGAVPFKDMPRQYQQMDILLMPTVREGFSLAVLEAMACGLPVVANNCSSLPEQVENGQGGFLCPAGDAKAFAEKLNLLAESPKLRREMGEYNRAKVEKKFTVEKMARAYQQLFEEVLTQFRKGQ